MAFVEDLEDNSLNSAMKKSEFYASEGFLYDAFIVMNKAIVYRFSRMGFIKAILYLFKMVDEVTVKSKIGYKSSVINDCYKDINRMTMLITNESHMHFWAGCIKLCQFRMEKHRSNESRLENLLKARQHLRCTLDSKPDHILASYIYTMCDQAYEDRTGTQCYYTGDLKLPDDFYVQCVEQELNYLLPFSFILGKLGLFVKQYYHSYHYVGIAMCVVPQTDFERMIYIQTDTLLDILIKLRNVEPEKDKPKRDRSLPKKNKSRLETYKSLLKKAS